MEELAGYKGSRVGAVLFHREISPRKEILRQLIQPIRGVKAIRPDADMRPLWILIKIDGERPRRKAMAIDNQATSALLEHGTDGLRNRCVMGVVILLDERILLLVTRGGSKDLSIGRLCVNDSHPTGCHDLLVIFHEPLRIDHEPADRETEG